jgi:sialidase-1
MPSSLRARLRSTLTAALTLAALLMLPSPAHATAQSAAPTPEFDQQVLFKASQDPGYACFRIPAVVKTDDGTLLAFAEGRVLNCGDAADIDIVVKRSTDDGLTWSPLQVVNHGGGDTHGNPAPIVDRGRAASCSPRRTTRAVRTAPVARSPATAPRTCSTATTTVSPGRSRVI